MTGDASIHTQDILSTDNCSNSEVPSLFLYFLNVFYSYKEESQHHSSSLMYTDGCFAAENVYHVNAWCPGRPEEGSRSPGTRVTDGDERPIRMLGMGTTLSARAASALNTILAFF